MTALSLLQQAARSVVASKPKRLPAHRVAPSVMVARALIVGGLRRAGLHHVVHREPATVGFVGVDDGSIDAFSTAARSVMQAELVGHLGYDVTIYDRTGTRRKDSDNLRSIVMDATRAAERAAVFFSTVEDVPAVFVASAEGVVTLDPVGRRVLRAAFMTTVGRAPGPEGLDLVASLPLDLLDSVVVKGRSVERSLEVARKLRVAMDDKSAATNPATVPAVKESDDGPRLEDLSGLGDVGEWAFDLVRDLGDYRRGTIAWADVDRGVLVAGPPGVGKTLVVGAIGRSCGVPVHLHSAARWQAKGHLGDYLRAMLAAFTAARASAPCILFLDEMDSFGSREDRDDHNASYNRQTVNGLLEQLDGAAGREGVVVVGATNNPDAIDPAILRPGRLERVLHMRQPDVTARAGILRYHLGNSLETTDLRPLAERLHGATGAEIEMLVRDARRRARRRRGEMTLADVEGGLAPEELQSDNLFRRVCLHEAGHLVVGTVLANESGSDPIEARVDRRLVGDGSAGFTLFMRRPGFDRTRESHLAEITTLLAGLASEEEILGSRGDGAGGGTGGDLRRATEIATALEASLGLGHTLLHRAAAHGGHGTVLHDDPDLRRRVEATLNECFSRARAAVRARVDDIHRVAQELATSGTSRFLPPTETHRPEGEAGENR